MFLNNDFVHYSLGSLNLAFLKFFEGMLILKLGFACKVFEASKVMTKRYCIYLLARHYLP